MVTRRVLPLIFIVPVGIGIFQPSTDQVYFALILGLLLAAAISVFVATEPRTAQAIPSMRDEVTAARTYWLSGIGAMASQLDAVIVGSVMGSSSAASFAAGYRFASPVHIVTTLLTSRYGPAMRHAALGQTPGFRSRPYLLFGIVYAVVIASLAPVASWLVVILLGDQYAAARDVITLFFVASAASVICQLLLSRLFALRQWPRLTPVIVSACTILGLTVVFIGASVSSVEMAASGNVVSQVVLLATLLAMITARRSSNG